MRPLPALCPAANRRRAKPTGSFQGWAIPRTTDDRQDPRDGAWSAVRAPVGAPVAHDVARRGVGNLAGHLRHRGREAVLLRAQLGDEPTQLRIRAGVTGDPPGHGATLELGLLEIPEPVELHGALPGSRREQPGHGAVHAAIPRLRVVRVVVGVLPADPDG